MFDSELEKLIIGFCLGTLLTMALFVLTLLTLIVPYFWIIPAGGVVGYILTKPKWLTQMWEQKEYRE